MKRVNKAPQLQSFYYSNVQVSCSLCTPSLIKRYQRTPRVKSTHLKRWKFNRVDHNIAFCCLVHFWKIFPNRICSVADQEYWGPKAEEVFEAFSAFESIHFRSAILGSCPTWLDANTALDLLAGTLQLSIDQTKSNKTNRINDKIELIPQVNAFNCS